MDKESLRREAERQGADYSRKVNEESETFFGSAWWDTVRRGTARWMMAQAARLLPPDSQPWDLLDVGCGMGFTAFEMARLGGARVRRITGLDASDAALGLAEKQRAALDPAQAEKLRFVKDNFFDHGGGPYHVVYMNEVFEHLPSAQSVFDTAHGLLHPGGLVLISTPNRDRLANRLRAVAGRAPALLDPMHVMEYTVRDMRIADTAWSVQAITGRQIADEDALSLGLSLGIGPLRNAVLPLCRLLARNRVNFALGAAAPAVCTDIFAAYRKGSA